MQIWLDERIVSDVQGYNFATDILQKLLSHFIPGRCKQQYFGLGLTRYGSGAMVLTLRGSEIGLSAPYDRLWFLFAGRDKREPTGYFFFHPQTGDPVVQVHCIDPEVALEFDVSELGMLLLAEQLTQPNTKTQGVVFHELIHYWKSFTDPEIGRNDNNYQDPADYYNSQAECDAYSTEFVKPLLRLLSVGQKFSASPATSRLAWELARHLGICITSCDETSITLVQLMLNTDPAVRGWVENLNPTNKYALVQRVHLLNYAAAAMLCQKFNRRTRDATYARTSAVSLSGDAVLPPRSLLGQPQAAEPLPKLRDASLPGNSLQRIDNRRQGDIEYYYRAGGSAGYFGPHFSARPGTDVAGTQL